MSTLKGLGGYLRGTWECSSLPRREPAGSHMSGCIRHLGMQNPCPGSSAWTWSPEDLHAQERYLHAQEKEGLGPGSRGIGCRLGGNQSRESLESRGVTKSVKYWRDQVIQAQKTVPGFEKNFFKFKKWFYFTKTSNTINTFILISVWGITTSKSPKL